MSITQCVSISAYYLTQTVLALNHNWAKSIIAKVKWFIVISEEETKKLLFM